MWMSTSYVLIHKKGYYIYSNLIPVTFLFYFIEQEVNLDEYVQTDLKSRNSTHGLWRKYEKQSLLL